MFGSVNFIPLFILTLGFQTNYDVVNSQTMHLRALGETTVLVVPAGSLRLFSVCLLFLNIPHGAFKFIFINK